MLGLGNLLLRDEGIGVHVVRELEKIHLPDDVEVIDAGTASLDVILSIGNIEKLVIVDAVKAGQKPGVLYRLSLGDLDEKTGSPIRLSLHQIGVLETLAIARKEGALPKEVALIGIEPEKIDCGLELSSAVAKRIPDIVKMVLKETVNGLSGAISEEKEYTQECL